MKDEEETVNSDISPKTINVSTSVLDAYDLLKAPKDDSKLTGGIKIISVLQNSKREKDLQYVLRRLIRSLGANIPDVRAGYFATLVAILKQCNQIKVQEVLELIKNELHANGSSKSEVGDVALGQILVCGAVFRSELITKSTEEEQREVIKLLMSASKKKSYLATVAHLILLDFVNGMEEDQFSTIVWAQIKEDFKKDLKDHSLDSLYFLLIVNKKFPNKVKLRKFLGYSEIICEDSMHALCEKLMAGIDFSSVNHPIFKEIGKLIANSPHLSLFWTSGIDTQLVKHNRNRELVAINLLTTILDNIQENFEVIPEILSKNFFKLFMDWFKGLQTASKVRNLRDDEDDHKLMIKKQKELLNALAKALKSDKVISKVRVEILKKLLFNPGEMNFTDVTGTSIVRSIVADLDKDGVKKMAKMFKGVLLNTSKKVIKEDLERSWFNNERLKAAEMISYLVIHDAVKDEMEFKLIYMRLLMCFGFFKIGGDENVTISGELSASIKTCFYRCFSSKFSNVDNLLQLLSSLCDFLNETLSKQTVRDKLEKQFPKENMECWEMLTEVCQNIEKTLTKSKVDKVFLILLYQLGLFLFSEPTHVKMAKSSIKELKSCYEHYRKGMKKKQKKLREGNLVEDEPEWIEVLVEVLLSILSTESSILRSVVQCVFRLIWEYLTPSSVGQIVSVLDPEGESAPLTEDSGSEEESEKNDESDSDDQEDKDDTEKDVSSDDSDSEDDDDDDDMKAPEQLKLAVQKALGTAVPDTDTESIDADMIDEEEGKKLDEALAEAFRQFHQGKNKKTKKDRKDKKALSDFRIRVLDLIDIYLEKDPSMDVCLAMIAPLTRSLEFCIADNQFSELENRLRKTIKILTKVKKFSSTDDVTVGVLCDYLKATIDKGLRSHFMFQALGDVITHFGTLIINCSQKLFVRNDQSVGENEYYKPLIEIFKEATQSYFQNRNCLLPIIFFHNVLQTDWIGSYEILSIIIDNTFNSDVRQYRRNEGLELMIGFYKYLKRSKVQSDIAVLNLTNLEEKFEKILTSTLKETSFEAKNNFFVLLKKLINIIKIFYESCKIKSCLDFQLLTGIVAGCKPSVQSKSGNVNHDPQNQKKTKTMKKKRKRKLVNGHSDVASKISRGT